jgi:polynucleotide 5'-hydroxyl-kinase GRC3/NOL9
MGRRDVEGFEVIIDRLVSSAQVVMLVGGLDTGKSTLGRALAAAALEAGRRVAYLDADLGQKMVGPPSAVSLRLVGDRGDLRREALSVPDALYFVGATSPQGQLLPLVVGAGRLLARAKAQGAEIVIVDTSGLVSGVYGQLLKYHKVEELQPDAVVGLQRGEELEPLMGIIQRFFPTEVLTLPIPSGVRPTSVDERARNREVAFRRYFSEPLQRWRVKPTVFMPALPALFDPEKLHRVLVGLSDGAGGYSGLGYLEYTGEDQVLRLVSPTADAPKALRLGSIRLEDDFRVRRLDLRNLFGTD